MALNNNTPFGVREICDVVLRAKSVMDIGSKRFYRNEPVLYFDTLKTSTLEGGSTTVYATGGSGNARLMAWEGERTVTFTMEDALISPASLSVLAGAELIDATDNEKIKVHKTNRLTLKKLDNWTTFDKDNPDNAGAYVETVSDNVVTGYEIFLGDTPYFDTTLVSASYTHIESDTLYVMGIDDFGYVNGEPLIGAPSDTSNHEKFFVIKNISKYTSGTDGRKEVYSLTNDLKDTKIADKVIQDGATILVDYYGEFGAGKVSQINITPETFGGNFYLEASTLFRDSRGGDVPAEFVIPNCKIQSNFTFNMSSTGDPSTFTFTMDAFPDYTRFDLTKKVIAAIQILDTDETGAEDIRKSTNHPTN